MGSQTGTLHWDGGCSQKDLEIQAQVNLSHTHRLANLVFVLSSPHSQARVPSVYYFSRWQKGRPLPSQGQGSQRKQKQS